MSKELPGFEKSAPTKLPLTKAQYPTSSWDIDTSPFHRLVEQQRKSTKELIETFLVKLEAITAKVEAISEVEDETVQDKILRATTKQVKEYADVRKVLVGINNEIINLQRAAQDSSDQYTTTLKSFEKNFSNLQRSIQKSLTKESTLSPQINHHLETLSQAGETCVTRLQSLDGFYKEIVTVRQQLEQQQSFHAEKFEQLQNILTPICLVYEQQFPDKSFWENHLARYTENHDKMFLQVIHHSECMVNSIENFNRVAENMEEIYKKSNEILQNYLKISEKQRIQQKFDSAAFWIFVVIALILFTWLVQR